MNRKVTERKFRSVTTSHGKDTLPEIRVSRFVLVGQVGEGRGTTHTEEGSSKEAQLV